VRLSGTVLDGAGDPIPDALVEIWSPDGGFGRSETVEGGRFSFLVTRPAAGFLEVVVFARGLLKQVVTRMYFPGEPVLSAVDPARRSTLLAVDEGNGLRFDIRLQGDGETVFFAP
jgi:protocatechuate 3,4-dioxygenase alpha subunit